MIRYLLGIWLITLCTHTLAQAWKGKFEQLDDWLPTPNSYRTASGAPGPDYWQQRADYEIDVEIDDNNQLLSGSETIIYYNHSHETLSYLWIQLDQNIHSPDNPLILARTYALRDSVPARFLASALNLTDYKGGYTLTRVSDMNDNPLPFIINGTMMRIDLPVPLQTGQSFSFRIAWHYSINDMMKVSGRSGMEYFPDDNNYIYFIAQWFPRMCVFDDYEGWQNKQFLGAGEFALPFGNYRVRITVPSDHIVAATGWLQNPHQVLTREQLERFEKARQTFDKPVFIVTEAEARKKEKLRSTKKSTWEFYAENVRDFAFASSRKFIWDAMAVKIGDNTILAQSLYPKEANPLWEQESTRAIKNTLEVYSARTFDYPYPTAISVNWVGGGMEYPMISFNGGRPAKDGSISDRTRLRMITVIVHEVGHNFFPMIVNSDERQWTWMDEGLNSFLEKETMRERYPHLNYAENTPKAIIPFMRGEKSAMRPIMASSDNQGSSFGSNGYGKPAAALTVLRETVIGPELFDKAFKEYAQRWAFKHPKPADFFRTMEDASGVDLDWFWRGWFYSTDHVDVTLADVRWYRLRTSTADPEHLSIGTGAAGGGGKSLNKRDDFSAGPIEFSVRKTPDALYGEFRNRLDEKAILEKLRGKNLYELKLINTGGLVTPLIIEWTYKDGSKEIERIPAEIWRTNENEVTKVFIKEKEVTNIVIDPNFETADVNPADNVFPRRAAASKFDQFNKGNN